MAWRCQAAVTANFQLKINKVLTLSFFIAYDMWLFFYKEVNYVAL